MICFVIFRNGHFHNVVSTFTNVVKLDVENGNVVSTFSSVVHTKVEMHIVDSTFLDVVNSNVEMFAGVAYKKAMYRYNCQANYTLF